MLLGRLGPQDSEVVSSERANEYPALYLCRGVESLDAVITLAI